jgi:hydrogenase maturation factor
MCFSIPKQIIKIKNGNATMEDKTIAKLGSLKADDGDYLLVYGNMAVEKIPKKKALTARNLIKNIAAQ